jgi:predicted negative regulator of RcsB-dependent stress response
MNHWLRENWEAIACFALVAAYAVFAWFVWQWWISNSF